MPHITLKMLKGRTDAQKQLAAEKLAAALTEAIGCNPTHISVSVEDFTPEEWQEQYRIEVAENDNIVLTPDYDPKELLK
ncbi:MAG: tautomerase family protein [Oscillospiraceae bacterium]|nr:tautomerase family protein [Oscillospiraceae bacterium]